MAQSAGLVPELTRGAILLGGIAASDVEIAIEHLAAHENDRSPVTRNHIEY
ncbi:hypothetical protein [Rhodopseudomonas sp. P2A-2r]|uniref:hypothetical protein n=1 Tax=unclassified Rhodopseudomonas TaxID=2638247 RepID=UPI00223408B5|nr:hypothetical protein [Rhodopseudomonas sp. P2A-2r]UZE48246.1 hypothetical protein ONR75_26020 [Rhodopseudomonas sp. P2A-2r]